MGWRGKATLMAAKLGVVGGIWEQVGRELPNKTVMPVKSLVVPNMSKHTIRGRTKLRQA